MYWVDYSLDTVERANLDGSDVQTIETGLVGSTGIAVRRKTVISIGPSEAVPMPGFGRLNLMVATKGGLSPIRI